MKKNLSVFLDLLRFLAALGVVIGHARGLVLPSLPYYLASPTECVAAFFVLSGFVIRFVTVEKESSWRSYACARFSRIVPVAFLALCVTIALDRIGERHNYASYASFSWVNLHTSLRDLASCLSFTNEVWNRHIVVGSDEPFWSLGFEVCYYVFFGLLIYASRRWKPLLVFGWALAVGPKIVLYLPLWLMGVACYEGLTQWHSSRKPALMVGRFTFVAGCAFLYLLRFRLMHGAPGPYHWDSLRQVRWSFVYQMGIGVGTSLIVLGFDLATGDELAWRSWSVRAIRWLAGGTFTLYLLHQPIILFMIAFFPHARDSRVAGLSLVLAAIVACYGLAEFAERRKKTAAAALHRLLPGDSATVRSAMTTSCPGDPSPGYSIVTVVFEPEFELLCLQARSIALYCAPALIAEIFVLDNFNKGMTKKQRLRLLASYGLMEAKVRILERDSFPRIPSAEGYLTQQLLKLLVSDVVTTDNYLVLDAKSHFIRPLKVEFLQASDGRPRLRLHPYTAHPLQTNLRNALAHFELDQRAHMEAFAPTVPPFTMVTSIVQDLLRSVPKDTEQDFADIFLTREFTEFFAYSAYLVQTRGSFQAIYCCNQPECQIVWGSDATRTSFLNAAAKSDHDETPVFAIHRRALESLGPHTLWTVAHWWVIRGLFGSEFGALVFILKTGLGSRWMRCAARIRRAIPITGTATLKN